MGTITCFVTDHDGAEISGDSQLTDFLVEQIDEDLNGLQTARIIVSGDDANIGKIKLVEREICIADDGTIIFHGPAIRPEIGVDNQLKLECRDARWYLSKQHIGPAQPDNRIDNSSFETDTSGWQLDDTDGYGNPNAAASFTTSTDYAKIGDQSVKITNPNGGQQTFAKALWTESTDADGLPIAITGWARPTGSGFAPAWKHRGIFIGYRSSNDDDLHVNPNPAYPDVWSFSPITDNTPKDQWGPHHASVFLPPSDDCGMTVRLYSPKPSIYWDTIKVIAWEQLRLVNRDVVTVMKDLVRYAQGETLSDAQTFSHSKTDFNLAVSGSTAGKTIDRRYPFLTFQPVYGSGGALNEFLERDPAIDWSIEYAGTAGSSSTRTVTFYASGRGTDRTATTLSAANANIGGWRVSFDGEVLASQVSAIGDGGIPTPSGQTIPYVAADTNGSALNGDCIHKVVRAPATVEPDGLTAYASGELDRSETAIDFVELDVVGAQVGVFSPGDTVTVTLDTAWPSGGISETMRVVQVSRRLLEGYDRLTLHVETEGRVRNPNSETPEVSRERFELLASRLTVLESRTIRPAVSNLDPWLCDYPGILTDDDISPEYSFEGRCWVTGGEVRIGTPGTDDVVLKLFVDGGVEQTLTISSSSQSDPWPFHSDIAVASDNAFTVGISASNDAENLTIRCDRLSF